MALSAPRVLVDTAHGRSERLKVFRGTIASGASLSDLFELGGRDIVGIRIEGAGIPTGLLRLQVPGDDGTPLDCVDSTGANITWTTAAGTSRHFVVSPLVLPCFQQVYVKLSANTTAVIAVELWTAHHPGGLR